MTFPSGMDPELIGTTKPEILQLALSGHLAAAAGGENHISMAEGLAAIEAVAPALGWADMEPEPETPAPASSTSSTSTSTSTSSSTGSSTS